MTGRCHGLVSLVAVLALTAIAESDRGLPVQKALKLLDHLKAGVVAEGKESNALYKNETELCKKRAGEVSYSIKTAKRRVEELKASIEKETAKGEALGQKMQALMTNIGENEDELQKATELRTKEAEDFNATETELVDTVGTISRASGVIEKELKKDRTSALQLSGANELTAAFGAMVQASSVSSASASRLVALLQTTRAASEAEDAEWSLQTPGEAVAYTRSGTGLLEALENLHRDAQEELETARKGESEAMQNYRLKKQSLEDSLKVAKRDLEQAKGELAESKQEKNTFSGDLKATQSGLAEDIKSEEELKKACLAKAQDYQIEAKQRAEEYKALEKAEAAIKEKVEGVEVPSASLLESGSTSFLQVSASKTGRLSPGEQVAHLVRSLGLAQDSSALMQLASRVESAVRLTPKAEELFGKIRGMIGEMLEQIQAEAKKEASKKAFCKKETSEAKEKQEEKENWFNKFSSRVEKMIARQSGVNDEVDDLRQELSDLASTQSQLDLLRIQEKAIFEKQRPEVQGALDGTKLAIKVLREYYEGQGNPRGDQSSTVVELLEVAESDFSKNIAEMDTEEERAKVEYAKISTEKQKMKLIKEQEVKYKAQEAAEIANALRELNSDLAASKEELDAVNEFLADLAIQCDLSKRETYEERVQKREAKMAMLKDCLKALEVTPTPSLLQQSLKIALSPRPVLRGTVWPHKIE